MDNKEVRRWREEIVRRHMESENVHDFDTVIETFSHPRYEIIPADQIHDGEAAVRDYFKETRAAFPDQRNELISVRCTEVIHESSRRGRLPLLLLLACSSGC